MEQDSADSNTKGVSAPASAPPKTAAPKTTGENYFGFLRFATGEAVILAATAVLAYIAHPVYGRDKYGPIPNVLKKAQSWLFDKMPKVAVKLLPFKEHISVRIGGAFAGTTLLMHGGNLFAPVMKMIEDRKEHIVAYLNKHFGKPGEVEAGNAHVRAEPKQNWGDIIKGRLYSWVFVFSSFVGADALLGKDSAGKYRFDNFEEWFGKKVAGLTAKGREAVKNETFPENKTFRFGKILALDIYATAAAIAVWTTMSKLSAMHRAKKLKKPPSEVVDIASDLNIGDADGVSNKPAKPYQALLDKDKSDFRTRAQKPAEVSMAL